MQNACEKYEEWGTGFVLLVVGLMTLWLILGVRLTYPAGVVWAGLFTLLFVSVFYSAFYLTCRHCYYYGKKCYLAVGLVVPYFFKKVEGPVAPWRATLWLVHLLLAIAFPLVFIFQDRSILWGVLVSIVYLAAPVTAMVVINRYSCPRCKHTECISNPDGKKHGVAVSAP
jgi:hypothetical protein